MATKSRIEWTEQTWNPTTGCTKISPGCKHCYAEIMAWRLQAMGASGYDGGFKLAFHPDRLSQPLSRRAPTTYFVNSMSDLFHERIPDAFLDEVMSVIRRTPHHTYQILTKRAQRLPQYFAKRQCPANVWLGVSVENRRYGVPRIDHLMQVEAQVRFLSAEPLLEDLRVIDLDGIHWVIVGGESGHRARPMRAEWVENIQRQAQAAGAAFFFKQWGTWGADGRKRDKKTNGRVFNGRTWDDTPRLPMTIGRDFACSPGRQSAQGGPAGD
jgi:protein gp37